MRRNIELVSLTLKVEQNYPHYYFEGGELIIKLLIITSSSSSNSSHSRPCTAWHRRNINQLNASWCLSPIASYGNPTHSHVLWRAAELTWWQVICCRQTRRAAGTYNVACLAVRSTGISRRHMRLGWYSGSSIACTSLATHMKNNITSICRV